MQIFSFRKIFCQFKKLQQTFLPNLKPGNFSIFFYVEAQAPQAFNLKAPKLRAQSQALSNNIFCWEAFLPIQAIFKRNYFANFNNFKRNVNILSNLKLGKYFIEIHR